MKRQKYLFLCFFLILMYHTLLAQDHPSFVGVKGGMNISNLADNNTPKYPYYSGFNRRVGSNVEIFMETRVRSWLSCQAAGLGFSSQGATKEGYQAFLTPTKYASYFQPGQFPGYLYGNFRKEMKLNYLMLASLVKFSTNSDRKFNAYSSIGYYTAYLLSAKEVHSGSGIVYKDMQGLQALTSTPQSFNEIKNIKADLHKFNIGISGNIGLSFNFNKTKIFVEGGGNYALININKKTESAKTYIKTLFGKIGFSFNIGEVWPVTLFK